MDDSLGFIVIHAVYALPICFAFIWIYDKKKSPKEIGKIFLLGLFFSAIGFGCAILWDKIYPIEKGFAGFVLGYLTATFLWAIFAKRVLKVRWLSLIFVSLMPISFFIGYIEVDSLIYHLGDSKREAQETAERSARILDSDFKAIQLSIEEFYRECGHLPKKLEDLMIEPAGCTKWEKSPYKDSVDGLVKDPWGEHFVYTINDKTHYEVKTLGADKRHGGQGIDEDKSFRGSP